MPNVPSLPERNERHAAELKAKIEAAINELPQVQREELMDLLEANCAFARAINATAITQAALNRATEPGYIINLVAVRNRRMSALPDAG